MVRYKEDGLHIRQTKGTEVTRDSNDQWNALGTLLFSTLAYIQTNSKQLPENKLFKHTQGRRDERGGDEEKEEQRDRRRDVSLYISLLLLPCGLGLWGDHLSWEETDGWNEQQKNLNVNISVKANQNKMPM